MGTKEIVYQRLQEQLQNDKPRIRKGAVEELALLQGEQAIELLYQAFQDRHWQVRASAVEALGKTRISKHTAILEKALRDTSQWVKVAAACAVRGLVQLSEKLEEGLLKGLEHKSQRVREACAKTLGQHQVQRVIPRLHGLLKDGSEKDRVAAVWALMEFPIQTLGVEEALTEALQDELEQVRQSAIHALAHLQEEDASNSPAPFLKALESDDFTLQKEAILALEAFGSEAVEALPRLLQLLRIADDPDKRDILKTIQAMGRSAEQATNRISGYFASENWELRQEVARTLGKLGAVEAIDTLTRGVNDRKGKVRKAAVLALGELHAAESVPPLTSALQDELEEVQLAAIDMLVLCNRPEAVPALSQSLQHSNWNIRNRAAQALGQIKHKEATLALLQAMNHPLYQIPKASILRSLGQQGDPAAISVLSQSLRDPSLEIRIRAAQALGSIKEPVTLSLLSKAFRDTSWQLHQAAAEVLTSLGTALLPKASQIVQQIQNSTDQMARTEAENQCQHYENATVQTLNVLHRTHKLTSDPEVKDATSKAISALENLSVALQQKTMARWQNEYEEALF